MNDYIETNRAHWDEVVRLHAASEFYDVPSFKAGRSTLLAVERTEVGDVRGKTLLHLQCHFGMDTLSWAREGAIVTGVDFSPAAISTARALASELGIEARFVESNIYDLPKVLAGSFDIVFASYGVVCWLPDFPAWARIAASYVKPGGFFYLIDGHPLFAAIDDDAKTEGLRLLYPYLTTGVPQPYPEVDGSYAAMDAKLEHRETTDFTHDLGEVVTSLIQCGLQLEFLREWPLCAWQALPKMTRSDDDYWRLPESEPAVPFMYSLRARKPA
ncbi:MAG TPA: class I SAM-dependent methyltransferase [Dehalococcoidia bacterium]|nr:class I SAM-dependent methyltransferase [Dehalococcoidia bacterium]